MTDLVRSFLDAAKVKPETIRASHGTFDIETGVAAVRKAVLEEAARVAEFQLCAVWEGHVTECAAYEMAQRDVAEAIRALAERTP